MRIENKNKQPVRDAKRLRIAALAMAVIATAVTAAAQAIPEGGGALQTPRHGSGMIFGSVVDAEGKAVDGVLVIADLMPSSTLPGAVFAPYTVSAVTFGGGNFSLIGIPHGRYRLCAEQQDLAVMNPCIWSDDPVVVTVSNIVPKPRLVVEKGANITIRVEDTNGHLSKAGAMDDILITTGHGKNPGIIARSVSKDSTGKTYTMLVPAGRELKLNVFSQAYQLADDTGKAFTTASTAVAVPAQAVSKTSDTDKATGLKSNAESSSAASAAKGAKPTITIRLVGPKGGKQ